MRIRIPLKFRLTAEELACMGLFLYLIKSPIKTFLYYVLRTPAEVNSWIAIVLSYIPVVLILLAGRKRRAFLRFGCVLLCIFATCMLTYLLHPEYEQWLFQGEFNIWLAIFRPDMAPYLFLFICLIDDSGRLLNTLKWAGFVLLAYNVYKLVYAELVRGYWVATGVNRGVEGEYNLGFGYDVLLLFVLFSILGKREGKRYYVLSAISLLCILVAGSRGPLVGVGLVVLLQLWEYIRAKRPMQRMIWIGGFLVVFGLILFNLSSLLMGAGRFLQELGISSRTVEMLADGSYYTEDSGRSVIWGVAGDLIRTGGPFGHGIYGDRYEIARQTTLWIGYCHNIVLEILVDFGYLLGGIILVVMLYRIVRILRAPESEWRSVYLIFLLSASQLIFFFFFWYISTFWGAIAADICWREKCGAKETASVRREAGGMRLYPVGPEQSGGRLV